MSKAVSLLSLVLLSSFHVVAQCGWFKIFDPGYVTEEPFELLEFADNYYVLLHAANNYVPVSNSGVLKFDQQGNFLWETDAVYHPDDPDEVSDIWPRDFIVAKDSSVFFFSTSYYSGTGQSFLINKFDKNGQFLWYKVYGVDGAIFDHGQNSLCLAADSLGIVMTGHTAAGDYVIYNIDSAGTVLWNHILDVPVMGQVGSLTPIVRMPENTFKTAYDNNVLPDFRDYLASLDSAGNLQYSFVNPLTGRTADLAIHPNGNLVYLSNERNPPMFEDGGMRIQMLTPEFDTLWSYLYFDTEFPYIFLDQGFVRNLSVAPNGKILASGYNGGNNMHLVCLSAEGELLWKREVAIEGEIDTGYTKLKFNRAIWTADGCILATGYIYGTSTDSVQQYYHSKIFLVKLDSLGCLEPGCNQTIITSVKETEGKLEEQWSISPNPASDRVVLKHLGSGKMPGYLIVHDAAGREVFRQNIVGETTTFAVKNWASGIYTVRIRHEKGAQLWSGRLAVQR